MIIIFDYLDKGQYYYKLLKRGGEGLSREIATVWENMQRFMDEEIVRVNGERVRPVLHEVYIALRGSPTRPYITFIGSFPAPLRPGRIFMRITTRRKWPSMTTRPCGYSPKALRCWSGTSAGRWRRRSQIYCELSSPRVLTWAVENI